MTRGTTRASAHNTPHFYAEKMMLSAQPRLNEQAYYRKMLEC